MENRCRKCGREIVEDNKKTKKLRCPACSYYVDQEIRGEHCRAFKFYFDYWLKTKQGGNIKKESS